MAFEAIMSAQFHHPGGSPQGYGVGPTGHHLGPPRFDQPEATSCGACGHPVHEPERFGKAAYAYLLGIASRRAGSFTISIARREAVARLDEFVGPKS
jgi:hypothetical protein